MLTCLLSPQLMVGSELAHLPTSMTWGHKQVKYHSPLAIPLQVTMLIGTWHRNLVYPFSVTGLARLMVRALWK